jgi:hypothetical protein
MSKIRKIFMMVLAVGWAILMATPVFAKSFSLKDAGISLWIFLIIGAMLVLLQLIPAAILFFTFIGTTSTLVFKGKKGLKKEENKLALPGYQSEQLKSR